MNDPASFDFPINSTLRKCAAVIGAADSGDGFLG